MKFRIAILLSVLTLSYPFSAMAESRQQTLSISDAIRQAAERNLDIKAELYNPAQYEADINRNRAIYDPVLMLQSTYTDTVSQSAMRNTNGVNAYNKNLLLNSSLSQLLPTGGTVALQYNNTYYRNNSPAYLYNNYWVSSLGTTLTQPLLKNFGRETTELAISVSRLSKSLSIDQLNNKLLTVIGQVKTEYFKLYNLREQLEVKKVSLQLAKKILADTKARVSAGVMPAMEIASAEFGVSSREKDLIDAEKAVNDQNDYIRLLLQLENGGEIITQDTPLRDELKINEEDALKRTLDRPDIKAKKRSLEISDLQSRVYRNKTRPDLSLGASGSVTGLDNTFSEDMQKVSRGTSPAWSVGLTFTYPLGNRAAENDYRKSRLQSEQIAVQIRALEESARNEVRSAIRNVNSCYKQIDVANRGRGYAEERLKAYIRKNQVGLATIKEVLDVENDLANAKGNQITALVNYDNAVTKLWQVTGELLEKEHVYFSENETDRLYKKISR